MQGRRSTQEKCLICLRSPSVGLDGDQRRVHVQRDQPDAIAAVVLGGTAIAGGRGLILGTLIGAILLGILNNGLNLMGINPYMQDVIKGAIILLAIYIGREW